MIQNRNKIWVLVLSVICVYGILMIGCSHFIDQNHESPEAFSLYNPINGAQIQEDELFLIWNPSINATEYEVFLCTTTAFHAQPTKTTTPVLWISGLSDDQVYYWKVVAKNALGQKASNDGMVWSFSIEPSDTTSSVPGSFSRLNPQNDAQDLSVNPQLQWSNSEGADYYTLWFGSHLPLSQSRIIYEPSYAPGPLEEATTYYWTVSAHNDYGTTPVQGDPYWFFTTQTSPTPPNPPSAFSMILPANGALDVDLDGLLFWQESNGATTYDLYLHTQPDFSSILPIETSVTQFSTGDLLPSTTYYWTVHAKNAYGSTQAGNGAIWSFTTIDSYEETPPQPFFLLSPSDGLIDLPLDPLFYWTKSRLAVQYILYIRQIPNLDWQEFSTTLTYMRVYDLEPDADYQWRVSAENEWGMVEGSEGAVWTFRTRSQEPETFADISGNWTIHLDTNLGAGLVFHLFIEQDENQLQTTLTVEGLTITLAGSIDTHGNVTMAGSDDLGTITFSGSLVNANRMEGTLSGVIIGNAVSGTWYAVR